MTNNFDFELHRKTAIQEYSAVRDKYEKFCAAIDSILRVALRHIDIHHISARAKDLRGFADKASKPASDDPTLPKYPRPLEQITDLAGVRIIVYVLRDLNEVEQTLLEQFHEIERIDKAEELLEKGAVGYRSIHYIVELRDDRTRLLEYGEFRGLRAEIQLRTILQHAWAEMEHDIRYKSPDVNRPLFQRFTALAGLIEIADREFEQVFQLDAEQKRRIRDLAQISDQPLRSSTTESSLEHPPTHASPRELIGLGRYSEAIIAYNKLVAAEPRQFSHFLGRGKARFLNGDVDGALRDLDAADRIQPRHRFTQTARRIIEGREPSEQVGTPGQRHAVARGHAALSEGDGAKAYEFYKMAEDLGLSPIYSAIDRAMARIITADCEGALKILAGLEPFPGSILSLIKAVLRAICIALSGNSDISPILEELTATLDAVRHSRIFSFSRGVLPILEQGLRRSETITQEVRDRAISILDVVRVEPGFEESAAPSTSQSVEAGEARPETSHIDDETLENGDAPAPPDSGAV